MMGTNNDRDMTGVLYGGVWEICLGKHIYITTNGKPKGRCKTKQPQKRQSHPETGAQRAERISIS